MSSISQSWTSLIKLTDHWTNIQQYYPCKQPQKHLYSKQFWRERGNILQGLIPTPQIMPKIDPVFPTHLKYEISKEFPHPLWMNFHTPTPYAPLPFLENHPPQVLPYLASITILQRASPSRCYRYLHSHFPKSALLKVFKFLTPKPPNERGVQILSHLSK